MAAAEEGQGAAARGEEEAARGMDWLVVARAREEVVRATERVRV